MATTPLLYVIYMQIYTQVVLRKDSQKRRRLTDEETIVQLGVVLGSSQQSRLCKGFYATPVDVTYSECIEAIEKGVAILTEPTANIFYYEDAMYVISPQLLSAAMKCYVQEFNK